MTAADLGLFHRLARPADGGPLVICDQLLAGDPDVCDAWRVYAGTEYGELDIDVSHAAAFNVFTAYGREDAAPSVREHAWDPFGVTSALAMNVARGGVFVGSISVFRRGERPFDDGELQAANRIARRIRRHLEAADAREARAGRTTGAHVFSPDGDLRFSTWGEVADEALQGAMAQAVEQFVAGTGRSDLVVSGQLLSMDRMDGDEGPAVLVTTQAVAPMVVADPMLLSPLKRRIVGYAIQGATVPEIARAIGRSPETVRSHLKRIYEQLGVGSRVELAEICRDVWT